MTSFNPLSRPQSALTPDSRTSSPRFFSNNGQLTPPCSSNDTAYNGSEGRIDDRVPSFDVETEDYQSPALSQANTPSRPTLGGRFLSSLSNAQPAAAALGRKGSVLHSRAKSLAGFVPKLSNTTTNTTPDRAQGANKLFQDFFGGEQAPIRIGAPVSPTKEKEKTEFVMEYRPSFTERPRAGVRRQSTTHSINSTPTQSKQGWFGRKSVVNTPTRPQQQTQDELASLNINASLFPNGPVDSLDPSSFNDLLINATTLLNRMQAAYKEKVDYIATIQPEIDAQREEVEETETRNAHLKMQLEDLGRRAQEQDLAMQEMAQQVQSAKIEAQEAREATKTIRVIRPSSTEGTPTRRKKRTSDGSASDSGFESDLDSVVSSAVASPPDYDGRSWELPLPPKARDCGAGVQRRAGNVVPPSKRLGGDDAAWATVDVLKSENRELHAQMEEMRGRLEECIGFVGMLNV